ncbi:MAG: hypothetical protein MUO31_13080 [Thermodesulfovibrionales bacterium]|nr:hypothetical protein [Thermodesulfovibrionales bacterium]
MNKCKDCKYYEGRECTNEQIASGSQNNPDNMLVEYGGYDGCGDYMNISPEFGCILFDAK